VETVQGSGRRRYGVWGCMPLSLYNMVDCPALFHFTITLIRGFLYEASKVLSPDMRLVYPLISCLKSVKGGKAAGSTRDCINGQHSSCTMSEPCTPCDFNISRTSLSAHVLDQTPCVSCETTETRTSCGIFEEGVGPYCWSTVTLGAIVPCSNCCSLST
jgi:hypothetical protein